MPGQTIASLTRDLRDALEAEHGACESNSCDITAAMREGLWLWAARLFTGATECERTERAYAAFQRRVRTWQKRLDAERDELCKVPSQECSGPKGCGAVIWNHEDERCGNCYAILPRVRWVARFSPHTGLSMPAMFEGGKRIPTSERYSIPGDDADDRAEAREECIAFLRARVKEGHGIARLQRRPDYVSWEVMERPDDVMVPDTVGILTMERVPCS